MNFKVHHIAFLTSSIEKSILENEFFGFMVENKIHSIKTQEVNVCFLLNDNGVRYELVQPFESNITLKKMIERGTSIYHVGYEVDSIEKRSNDLFKLGYIQLNIFNSEAFDNRLCSFFISRERNLIELIEI